MIRWAILNVLYQFGFCPLYKVLMSTFFPALKSSWTQDWSLLLKTRHLCGTAQSCQFIQKWSTCYSCMLLSQCIQKFCFNCFFPPVVHGLKQYCYCPVHLFSIPGNAPHCICVSQSTSRVLRAYLDKICLLYEVMASNCQTLLLLTYLSSSSCSVSRLSAAKGREVPVEWAGRSCTWENHKIRNDRKGQLDMSPSSQWRLSRDECKEASGSRH